MNYVAIDTEGFPIGPEAIHPKVVCLTHCVRLLLEGEPWPTALISNGDGGGRAIPDYLTRVLQVGNDTVLVFHNAGYDVPSLCLSYPELEPLFWAKLIAGEITDTMVRERLLNLSTTGKLDKIALPDGSTERLGYGLDDLLLKYKGLDISESKTDPGSWRVQFYLLDGRPAAEYPEAAADYAKKDAKFTMEVFEAQQALIQSEDGYASCGVQFFQTAAMVALAWMTNRGIATDQARVAEVRARLEGEYASRNFPLLVQNGIITPEQPARPHVRQEGKALSMLGFSGQMTPEQADAVWWELAPEKRQALEAAGIKFKAADGSHRSDKALQALVEKVCGQFGIPVRLTETGQTQCSDAVLSELAPLDPIIAQYQARSELDKLVNTEIPRMLWKDQPAVRVHAKFNVLVETGRTSSFGNNMKKGDGLHPAMNGQNVDPRIRPCYVPDDGNYLASHDYSTLELVTLAQTCYTLFGASSHRDRLIKGQDLHAYLGSQLALRLHPDFGQLCADVAHDGDEVYKIFASFKKSKDPEDQAFYKRWRKFAKPVGLGYPGGLGPFKFINLARGDAYRVDVIEEAMKFPVPDEVESVVLYYARKLFGMDEDSFAWNPVLRGIAFAARLKSIWLNAYPEMPRYFEHVSNLKDPHNVQIGVKDDGNAVEGLCYTSPMGMHRAGASFSAVANGLGLQTPAAEAAKTAVIRVVESSRIGKLKGLYFPVLFIHDELVGEVRKDRVQEALTEVSRIMEDSLRLVCPDVPGKAQACIMTRWHKEAEASWDASGNLIPWEPKH